MKGANMTLWQERFPEASPQETIYRVSVSLCTDDREWTTKGGGKSGQQAKNGIFLDFLVGSHFHFQWQSAL